MDNSARAIREILKHEGGYVDHPHDPGGATNKGITIETFRRYIKPGATTDDLRKLTEEQAVLVYKRQFWDRVGGDSLPSGVDYAVMDFAVNSGPTRAVKFLQRIVGSAQDGRMGPATLAATEAMPADQVINILCDLRLAFMHRARHSKTGALLWPTFKNGWAKRVADVRSTSLDWAARPPTTSPNGRGIIAAILVAVALLFRRRKKR